MLKGSCIIIALTYGISYLRQSTFYCRGDSSSSKYLSAGTSRFSLIAISRTGYEDAYFCWFDSLTSGVWSIYHLCISRFHKGIDTPGLSDKGRWWRYWSYGIYRCGPSRPSRYSECMLRGSVLQSRWLQQAWFADAVKPKYWCWTSWIRWQFVGTDVVTDQRSTEKNIK